MDLQATITYLIIFALLFTIVFSIVFFIIIKKRENKRLQNYTIPEVKLPAELITPVVVKKIIKNINVKSKNESGTIENKIHDYPKSRFKDEHEEILKLKTTQSSGEGERVDQKDKTSEMKIQKEKSSEKIDREHDKRYYIKKKF